MNRILSKRLFTSTGKYPKTYEKILIANRGEISRRIQDTCRKMGIKTVAVYSDADRHAMFVREADEAYRIGPPPSNQSYLLQDVMLDVVKKSGAQAVHPGYGFLSENADFQRLLTANKVMFIGPPTKAITAMGDKIESKKLANEAKVNTIPGYLGVIKDGKEAAKISNEIGYPVMIKASAGGGGKGMRIAWNDEEAEIGFRLSTEEAISSFGDGRIFVEKYIEEPRHIEFQILGDQQGNYVYLPERECSVQRRNQKVIEEAPSLAMDPKTRDAMGTQACNMARSCGYYTTGTCEFLMDKHKMFYFLEMNTRLQVEHPITEMITGIDLVEEMIKIAAGHPLEYKQNDVKINGHSIEYRIYAEDPARKFLPSIGFLERYREPAAVKTSDAVRIDTGVEEGSEISMFYDPMISKLVTWGKDRTEAIALLNQMIDEYVIRGVNHNSGFCKAIINHPAFVSGQYSTAFIGENYPTGYKGEVMTAEDKKFLSIVSMKMRHHKEKQFELDGYKYEEYPGHLNPLFTIIDDCHYKVTHDPEKDTFKVEQLKGEVAETMFDEVHLDDFKLVHESVIHTKLTGAGKTVDKTLQFNKIINYLDYGYFYRGGNVKMGVYSGKQYECEEFMAPPVVVDYSKAILAPMPGNIVSVSVEEGDPVVEGQEILVIEAMKMQNIIRSEVEKKIKKIKCKVGQSVAVDEVLIDFD